MMGLWYLLSSYVNFPLSLFACFLPSFSFCSTSQMYHTAGQLGHRMEVCAQQTLDELLWWWGDSSTAVQHHSNTQDQLARRQMAAWQDVQLFSCWQGEQMANCPRRYLYYITIYYPASCTFNSVRSLDIIVPCQTGFCSPATHQYEVFLTLDFRDLTFWVSLNVRSRKSRVKKTSYLCVAGLQNPV